MGGQQSTGSTPADPSALLEAAATEATPLKRTAKERWAHVRRKFRTGHRFKKLIMKPNRPPLPGSPTPAGYVIHKRPPPKDATWSDRMRDSFLDFATQDWITYTMVVWGLALLADAVVFFGCLLYLFDWGSAVMYGTDYCDHDYDMPSPRFSCNATTGALTYSVEDYWQEQSAAWMSWLFLYAVLLATPWRLSILFQLWEPRCKGKEGVDFYGRPSDFNFFHIPLGARWAIALLLLGNIVLQLTQSILYIYPWNNVWDYISQPQGTVLLLTGPLQGCLFGGGAGAIQIYWETQLHEREPKRFPPSLYNTVMEIFRWRRMGNSFKEIFASIK